MEEKEYKRAKSSAENGSDSGASPINLWNSRSMSTSKVVKIRFSVSLLIRSFDALVLWIFGVYNAPRTRGRREFGRSWVILSGLCRPCWCVAGNLMFSIFFGEGLVRKDHKIYEIF